MGTVTHVSDKDQQIIDLKIEPQKEEDTRKILLKGNVEMNSKNKHKKNHIKTKRTRREGKEERAQWDLEKSRSNQKRKSTAN